MYIGDLRKLDNSTSLKENPGLLHEQPQWNEGEGITKESEDLANQLPKG